MTAQQQAWWLCRDDPERVTARCKMVLKETPTQKVPPTEPLPRRFQQQQLPHSAPAPAYMPVPAPPPAPAPYRRQRRFVSVATLTAREGEGRETGLSGIRTLCPRTGCGHHRSNRRTQRQGAGSERGAVNPVARPGGTRRRAPVGVHADRARRRGRAVIMTVSVNVSPQVGGSKGSM